MNKKTKIMLSGMLAIITSLIVVVGVFIPIMTGLEDNVVSIRNNETTRFMVIENDEGVTITKNGTTYDIGGVQYDGNASLVAISDNVVVRMTATNMIVFDDANNIHMGTNSITFDKGTYSYLDSDGNTRTGTFENLLYPNPRGDYGCFYSSGIIPFSADNDEPVYCIGVASNNNYIYAGVVKGGVQDGFLFNPHTLIDDAFSSVDASSVTIAATGETSEDGLSFHYTGLKTTAGGSEYTPNVYAPITYSVIDTNAETVRTIMGVLPIVMIILVLVMAAGMLMTMVGRRNNDI